MGTVADHLEHHLGKITRGWASNHDNSVQVVEFRDQPERGARTLATLGLSLAPLAMPKGRQVRQELLLCAWESYDSESLASVLGSVGDRVAASGNALLQGEVLGPGDPVCEGVSMRWFYVSIPVVYDAALGQFDGTTPSTVFAWLIPITDDEAEFVQTRGWSEFELLLERSEADLLELRRSSIGLS